MRLDFYQIAHVLRDRFWMVMGDNRASKLVAVWAEIWQET